MVNTLVTVGILHAHTIQFVLEGTYHSAVGLVQGAQKVEVQGNRIIWNGREYSNLTFSPTDSTHDYFTLMNVTIGIDFHWQRKENQSFKGELIVILEGNQLVAINRIDVEEYLTSVISSEMSQHAGLELLKAHAVISRSWLLAQIELKKHTQAQTIQETAGRRIKWYDHDDHTLYDVCADDHCQRYQGITRATNPNVSLAIDATKGQVLMHEGKLCDARFSKCCGGKLELFSSCWENQDFPYLISKEDPFCNTNDQSILHQVLNNYDQETIDFYRWQVTYSVSEISELIGRKTGIDFGKIIELIPIRRGPSGRIIELQIVGEKRTLIIGKELEIRRTLSESHLFSSAFTVEKTAEAFILRGKGWGHGVGLCQIGAAVMGCKGYTYSQILDFYYPNTQLVKNNGK